MTDSLTPEEVSARVRHWLENGGIESLFDALAQARRDAESLRLSTRVDWRTMMEPCTI
jgi:gluconate kinase